MATDTAVRIELMGRFAVSVGDLRIDDEAWPGRRAIELVQLLALSEHRELLRDQVIDALWPHLDPSAGAANVRKAAHHARRALGTPDAVVLRDGRVALFPNRMVSIDVHAFEGAARAAGDPLECSRVADTWGGELLPAARYEEWTQPARAHLHRLQLDLLRRAGRWSDVVALAPTEERAYQELMREAIAAGARASAIRWYEQLRTALESHLGVGPDQASVDLYRRCLDGLAPAEPPLFGRSLELATLEAARAADDDEVFGAVVVRGPAGIGKSALCRAAARTAARQGWSVRSVIVEEGDATYGPLITCIDEIVAESPSLPGGLPTHAAAVLAALSPSVATDSSPDGPLSRHQVIGAFQQLLVAASAGAPVLLVVDDVHLADDATIEVLAHMASTVRKVLLVFTQRDGPARRTLDDALHHLSRVGRLRRLDLGPLDRDALTRLVHVSASGDMNDDEVDAIVRRAEGNPFVARELARVRCPGDGSSSLSDLIVGRLASVDEDAIAMLRRLALASDDLDGSTIVALTGDTEAAALAVLDRALAAGVLVVHGTRYRFRHALVREALVERVPPHQRAAVHRDVARRLAVVGGPPATIARHWLAGDEPGQAVPWSLEAARDAMRLGAFQQARRHVETVLAHEPTNAEARRIDAEALDNQGLPASLPAYDAAIEVAGPDTRDDLVAMRALAQLKQGDPAGALDSIRDATPTSVTGRLCEALTHAGAAALGFTDPSLGAAKAAECRRLALRSGDSAAIVVASWAQAAAAHARGELHDSVMQDLRDTSDLPHLAVRVFDGQLCITQRFLYGSRPYPEVIAFADALAAEGERCGAARGHAFGVTLRGEAELLSGSLDAAQRDLMEGARLHRAIGGATGEALALQRLAELALRRGERAEASMLLADALDLARVTDIGFHLLDRIYGTRIELARDADDALALVAEAESAVRGPLETCPGCRITFAVPAAIACARAGEVDRARALRRDCDFLAHVVMRLPAWDASYEEVLGHLALATGDRAAASRHFTEAARGFDAAGHGWDRDRCTELASPG